MGKKSLVFNEAAPDLSSHVFQMIVANNDSKIRYEKMGAQEYLVAPVSMLVPGVLNGSKGPLYYPKSEVLKNAHTWNGIPLTLGHPTNDEGNGTSARVPAVMEKFALGFVYNTTTKKGKLDGEAWFDLDRTQALAPEILDRLEEGKTIELSTGLFTDNHPTKNGNENYKGKPYVAIARNYQPDHLAVLPNSKGACSVEDGCGVLVNELSHQGLHEKLNDELRKEFQMGGESNAIVSDMAPWIIEVFKSKVIYQLGNETFEVGYSVDRNEVVSLSDDFKKVVKTTQYEVVDNKCGCAEDGHGCGCDDCKDKAKKKKKRKPTKNCDFGPHVSNSCGAGGGKGKPGFQKGNACAGGGGKKSSKGGSAGSKPFVGKDQGNPFSAGGIDSQVQELGASIKKTKVAAKGNKTAEAHVQKAEGFHKEGLIERAKEQHRMARDSIHASSKKAPAKKANPYDRSEGRVEEASKTVKTLGRVRKVKAEATKIRDSADREYNQSDLVKKNGGRTTDQQKQRWMKKNRPDYAEARNTVELMNRVESKIKQSKVNKKAAKKTTTKSSLPKTRSRVTISQASKALGDKGYKLGKSSVDLKKKMTSYEVTGPNGKTKMMTTDQIKKLAYK